MLITLTYLIIQHSLHLRTSVWGNTILFAVSVLTNRAQIFCQKRNVAGEFEFLARIFIPLAAMTTGIHI